MVFKLDHKYNGIAHQSWGNNSFLPDLPDIDVGASVDAIMKAGTTALAMMPKLVPEPQPQSPRPFPGGLGKGLGPRMLPPYAGYLAVAVVVAAAGYELYKKYNQPAKIEKVVPVGEPNLDDLRRMLEDAEREHRELEKKSPAWYANPFSPDVTRHHAKLTEVSLWIERLKLEIDLKEWEEVHDVVRANQPFDPSSYENRHIADLKHQIATHATTAEKMLGALGGIVASASSGSGGSAPVASAASADEAAPTAESPAASEPVVHGDSVVDVVSLVVRQWGIDIGLQVKEGIIDHAAIQQIEVFRKVFPEADGMVRFKVRVTDTLPEQISDWGFAFMDRSHAVTERLKAVMRGVNDALKSGRPLSSADALVLQRADDEMNALLDEFKAERATLEWIAKHLGAQSEDKALCQAIKAAMHDSQYSVAKLQTIMVPLFVMPTGKSVDDKTLAPSPNVSSSSLHNVVRDALARSMVELDKEGVVADTDSIGFSGVSFQVSPKETQKVVLVVQNLMTNGGRYSDSNKAIKMVAISGQRLMDGSLEVTVKDNGIGIPADKIRKLGEFEYQTAQKAVEGSTGRGIWSVIKILKDLGFGPLQVKSVEGEGSSFRFVIPQKAFKVSDSTDLLTANRTAHDLEDTFIIPDAAKP